MFRMGYFDKQLDKPVTNAPEHRAVALDVARAGIVLLKNEKNILPLQVASVKSIAVIGPNAEVLRSGGGGSSMVIPVWSETPLNGIKRTFPNAAVSFAVGARLTGDVPAIEPQYFFLPNDTTGKNARLFNDMNLRPDDNGLVGEYFDNKELKGEPKLRRVDKNIEFRWGGDKPAEGFGVDNFSVRWTGRIQPAISGLYEITVASDDGIRLFIDGKLVIEHWNDHAVEARMAKINFESGKFYDVKVEYYENGGDAVALVGWTKPNENECAAAVDIAAKSEIALIFAGHSHYQESEGFDGQSIDLPENQIQLINEVAKVNRNTIVVLNAGTQVNLLPWLNNVRSLVWAFFPGQEGTQAMVEILSGAQNPSGKLPFTIAQRWEDYPSSENFPGADSVVEYKEGILVGYRYFDTKNIEPLFPFGFGMSYTTYALSNANVRSGKNGLVEISVDVQNTGSVSGSEVVQTYVKDIKPAVVRPEKELKAFARVTLNPGEKKRVSLKLSPSSFQYYDDISNNWVRSKGEYRIFVGTSSKNVVIAGTLK
jgi:beta-glucosidase